MLHGNRTSCKPCFVASKTEESKNTVVISGSDVFAVNIAVAPLCDCTLIVQVCTETHFDLNSA